MVLSLAILGLLGACKGHPTPYQSAVDGYGYSEKRIEDNRYRVIFAGNDHTKADTVQNYLLYRAAELTLNHGYDYFTVVDRNLDRSTRYSGSSSTSELVGNVTEDGVNDSFSSTYSADPFHSYTAYGEKPASDVHAYDARSVLRKLSPSIAAAPGVMRRAPEQPEPQQQAPQE